MSIEQEALAIFAGDLATFLEQAIARLDSLGGSPEQLDRPRVEEQPEKSAKKPRKKKAEVTVAEAHPEVPEVSPDVVVDAA